MRFASRGLATPAYIFHFLLCALSSAILVGRLVIMLSITVNLSIRALNAATTTARALDFCGGCLCQQCFLDTKA